jgi:hypothetical protein
MGWSSGGLMSHGSEHEMSIPLIPAPVAMVAMMVGLAIGIVIGHKKSMMHGMGGWSRGGGHDSWGEWAARKRMMGGWSGHHHHGDGKPPCGCGHEGYGEGAGEE